MLRSLFRSAIPDESLEYAGFVLAHCAAIADSNRDGELICPFAVLTSNAGRHVVNFESETQSEAVSKGWDSLADAKSNGLWWAFGREGIYRTSDGASDVFTVSVWLPRMKQHISILQRFMRGTSQELRLVGNVELLMHGTESATTVAKWNQAALTRGIASHPKGTRWVEWQGP